MLKVLHPLNNEQNDTRMCDVSLHSRSIVHHVIETDFRGKASTIDT